MAAREICINIDDLAQVDALFTAVENRWGVSQLESYLRQSRSEEEIRRDNEEAQRDYEREAFRQRVRSVSDLFR